MPKKPNQSNNWNFNVVTKKLVVEGTGQQTPFIATVREDSGDVLGVASEHYGVIQNSQLIDAARNAMDTMGIATSGGVQENIIATKGGARMYAMYTFKNMTADRQKGDTMGYRITLKNSFDRSGSASLELGFLRLICTNGMVSLEPEYSLYKKHSLTADLSSIPEILARALASGDKAMGVFNRLEDTAISMEQGLFIIGNLVKAGTFSEKLAEDIKSAWLNPAFEQDSGRNLYNLYNAITYVLSRKVEAERFEMARRVNFSALAKLRDAAMDSKKLDKLFAPIEIVVS